jgi:hypothetical protein
MTGLWFRSISTAWVQVHIEGLGSSPYRRLGFRSISRAWVQVHIEGEIGLVPGGVVGLFEEFVEALEAALVEATRAQCERKDGGADEDEEC